MEELITKQLNDWLEAERENNFSDDLTVLGLNESDFVNYKKPVFMIYSGISCTFKCEKECGKLCCQNNSLVTAPKIKYSIDKCIKRFDGQSISKVIAFQGLEPLDNLKELLNFIRRFRQTHDNEIIIWTGYTENECSQLINVIKDRWKNIIIKFGRFVPGRESHIDPVLGIALANCEQYAKFIS